MSGSVESDIVTLVTGFTRALHGTGATGGPSRVQSAITAIDLLDRRTADHVYWALRVTLCADRDDLSRFDELFDVWFRRPNGDDGGSPAKLVEVQVSETAPAILGAPVQPGQDPDVLGMAAADDEVLRQRDVADLDEEGRDEVNRLIAMLAPRTGHRLSRRLGPNRQMAGRRVRLDVNATVRAMLRAGGEPSRLTYARRRPKPRRLVMLIDVSGSMAPYADALLRFGHAAVRVAPERTEVFTVGTRLTRVTRQLRLRDPELALRAAGAAVPDWSGGTRLGESLRAFLDLWGQRGTARGAVVVIGSDGWERGDAAMLGEQMARLARLAHRVVWTNPHSSKEGFAPLTSGMMSALPSIDDLLAGHSLDALCAVADVISRA